MREGGKMIDWGGRRPKFVSLNRDDVWSGET